MKIRLLPLAAFILLPVSIRAQTGTFSRIQSSNCVIANGGTTCSLTVSPSLASGNLYVFSCVVPNGAGSPVSKISSVSAGGALVLALGASMGSQPSGSNLQQSTSYILPSASSGGATPIVITLSQASSSTGGNCSFAEYHPSANPNNVDVDIDGSFQPATACTSCVDLSAALSATNDVVFKTFTSVGNYNPPTAITSPYDTNKFLGSFMGTSDAITSSGTGPTWTSPSTIPVLGTIAFGWNPAACIEGGMNDFTGGTNGVTVTGSVLAASMKGWQGGQWIYNTGGVNPLSYWTAAAHQLPTSTGRYCGDGGTYPTGPPTTGIGYTGNGMTMGQDQIYYSWSFNNANVPMMSSGFWYWSDRGVGDSADPNLDCSSIYGIQAMDFISVNCYIDGTTPYFNLEAASGNATQSHVSYTASTWVFIQQIYTSVGNSAGGNASVTASVSAGTATFTGTFTSAKYPVGLPFSVASCSGGSSYNGTLFLVVSASASTITALANGASGSATGCTLTGQHVMTIYDSALSQLGMQWANSTGADFPGRIHLGNLHAPLIIGNGKHAYFGSFKLSLNGANPIEAPATGCSGASPTWIAASASSSDVQACMNETLTCGDTILVPTGTATWTSQVTMTPPSGCSSSHGITLQGATICTSGCAAASGGVGLTFADNTVITLSNASGASLFAGQCSNTAFCTIDGFTFVDGVAQSNGQLAIQGTHGQTSFRIHNIHFQSALTSGVDATFYNGYGLIDHWLTNSTSSAGTESTPLNFGGDLASHGEVNWNDVTNFGSAEAIFVEDSNFISANGGSAGEGFFDAYYGCKITIRYSIVSGFQLGGWHGTDSGGYRSCVLGELYRLTISTTPSNPLGNTRGAVLLFHDNVATGNWSSGWNLQYFRVLGQASSAGWGRAGAHRDWTPQSINQSTALSSVVTLNAPNWQANHAYTCSAGSPCQIGPSTNNAGTGVAGAGGYNYEATATCTSGGSAPTWNQSFPSGTQSDGTCTWTNIGGGTAAGPGGSGFCAANPDTPASSDATCNALSGGDTASRFLDANGGVYPFRDQPGRSHNQLLTPNYAWNNSGAGLPSPIFYTDAGTSSIIQSGTDYFTNTVMPGYVAYTYPHPLQGLLGGSSSLGASKMLGAGVMH